MVSGKSLGFQNIYACFELSYKHNPLLATLLQTAVKSDSARSSRAAQKCSIASGWDSYKCL